MWKLREAQRIRKLSIVTEQVYGGHSSNADISDGKIHSTLPPGLLQYFFFSSKRPDVVFMMN